MGAEHMAKVQQNRINEGYDYLDVKQSRYNRPQAGGGGGNIETRDQRFVFQTKGRQKEWDAFYASEAGKAFFGDYGRSSQAVTEEAIPQSVTWDVVDAPKLDKEAANTGARANQSRLKGMQGKKTPLLATGGGKNQSKVRSVLSTGNEDVVQGLGASGVAKTLLGL